MAKKQCHKFFLAVWWTVFWTTCLLPCHRFLVTDALEIPLPGGRRISFEDGGIVRIQLDDTTFLPTAPPLGTEPSTSTLASIEVRDTGTTKGFGAFCINELIPKSTFLGFYEGELIKSREELETLQQRRRQQQQQQLATNLKVSDYSSSSSSFFMEYVMSLDGGQTFLDGYQRAQNRTIFSPCHLNHEDKSSEKCNCIRVLSSSSSSPSSSPSTTTTKQRQIAFFTARDIQIGEELCFDYGKNYWQGRETERI